MHVDVVMICTNHFQNFAFLNEDPIRIIMWVASVPRLCITQSPRQIQIVSVAQVAYVGTWKKHAGSVEEML